MLWWYTASMHGEERTLTIRDSFESMDHAFQHLPTDLSYGVYNENDIDYLRNGGWEIVQE